MKKQLSAMINPYYDKSISLDPGYAESYYEKGSALRVIGKVNEALDCYEKTISLMRKPRFGVK